MFFPVRAPVISHRQRPQRLSVSSGDAFQIVPQGPLRISASERRRRPPHGNRRPQRLPVLFRGAADRLEGIGLSGPRLPCCSSRKRPGQAAAATAQAFSALGPTSTPRPRPPWQGPARDLRTTALGSDSDRAGRQGAGPRRHAAGHAHGQQSPVRDLGWLGRGAPRSAARCRSSGSQSPSSQPAASTARLRRARCAEAAAPPPAGPR